MEDLGVEEAPINDTIAPINPVVEPIAPTIDPEMAQMVERARREMRYQGVKHLVQSGRTDTGIPEIDNMDRSGIFHNMAVKDNLLWHITISTTTTNDKFLAKFKKCLIKACLLQRDGIWTFKSTFRHNGMWTYNIEWVVEFQKEHYKSHIRSQIIGGLPF